MIKKMMFIVLPGFMAVSFLFCSNTDSSRSVSILANQEIKDTTIAPTGAIAYVRNGEEIRVINRDGSNDRKIWLCALEKANSLPSGLQESSKMPTGLFASGCVHLLCLSFRYLCHPS